MGRVIRRKEIVHAPRSIYDVMVSDELFQWGMHAERNDISWHPKPFCLNNILAAMVGVVSMRDGLSYHYQYLIEITALDKNPFKTSHLRVVTFREVAAMVSSKVVPIITVESISSGFTWAHDALYEYKKLAKQYITRSDTYGMVLLQTRHGSSSIPLKREIAKFRESHSLVTNPWDMANIAHQEHKIIDEQLDWSSVYYPEVW